jgi:hypothetical protein
MFYIRIELTEFRASRSSWDSLFDQSLYGLDALDFRREYGLPAGSVLTISRTRSYQDVEVSEEFARTYFPRDSRFFVIASSPYAIGKLDGGLTVLNGGDDVVPALTQEAAESLCIQRHGLARYRQTRTWRQYFIDLYRDWFGAACEDH